MALTQPYWSARRSLNRSRDWLNAVLASARFALTFIVIVLPWSQALADAPDSAGLRLVTWNVQNWAVQNRIVSNRFRSDWPKPEVQKAAVRRILHRLRADVVLLQEMGDSSDLDELQRDLRSEGLEYTWSMVLNAADSRRRLAVLSRLPWTSAVAHHPIARTGAEGPLQRGILEIVIAGPAGESLHIFNLHLKSSVPERGAPEPSPLELRTAEATSVRELIRRRWVDRLDRAYFLVAGDLNALADEPALRRLQRRGKSPVLNILPATDSRGEVWTWRNDRRGVYSRLDWILVSSALLPKVVGGKAWIPNDPDSAVASDHRPVVVDLIW